MRALHPIQAGAARIAELRAQARAMLRIIAGAYGLAIVIAATVSLWRLS